MSDYYDLTQRGLTETIAADGGSFQWRGKTYGGAINYVTHSIATAKSYFTDAAYPKCGDMITIAGRKFQVTRKGNSAIKAVSGGFVEDPPFIDDPTDPSLDLVFDHLIKK